MDRQAFSQPCQLCGGDSRDRHFGEEDLLRDKFLERALVDDPAADDDGHAVADHLDILKNVGGQEDRLSFLLEPDDDVPDLFPAERVEAAERFVQDDERRIVDEGLGEPDPLKHAAGEFSELEAAGLFQTDKPEEGVDPGFLFAFIEEEQVRVEGEELAGR